MNQYFPLNIMVTMEQISGYIERITFHNGENGYTIAHLIMPKHKDTVCIVGIMPGIQPGETVRCFGEWKNHLVHGKQFIIDHFRVEAPADEVGIRKYLGSGLIKGIGRKYADKIVDLFGVDTLAIIEATPERLKEISGLGAKRIDQIKTCWIEQKSIRDVMVFLQSFGVSPSFAQKIFKMYGAKSVATVKENPYVLARDLFGIGFKTADTLAQKMGISIHSPTRLDAGIEHLLNQFSSEGHVCYPTDLLLQEAAVCFEVEQALLQERIIQLIDSERIVQKDLVFEGEKKSFLWLAKHYFSEIGIVREIHRLKKASCSLRPIDMAKALDWVQEKLQIELAENQKKAVDHALTDKFLIITGGPGTGKSTITNAILTITLKLTGKVLLAAPTGRAAKRMSEITKHKASTIHSLLSFNFKAGGFKHNKENPLDCDLLIVDETSMIDVFLMYSLLRAIPDHARVIFVGDVNQLPSVGPGTVLKDLINSLSVSTVILNEIFRQAAGSAIITNAHKINKGLFPDLNNHVESDFFFIEQNENQDVLNTILKLVSQRLPNKYGFHSTRDIQVLVPMKKGIIGIENLNQALQGILNKQDFALVRGMQRFQVNDKVMQIRNNYKKEVFNGDIGYILSINQEDQQVIIKFEDLEVIYAFSEMDEVVLAYAISIHKFQGSECPCVVIPVHTSHFMMLHRNLLYTGVTRGKKLVVLVGTKKALAIAIKKDDVQKRYTSLQQNLMEFL